MNRLHFRRRPRPTDPEPYTRLDWLDGLASRYDAKYAQCDETCTADCGHCKGRRFGPYALPGRTRYDAEWPSVLAAEAPGGVSADEWSSLPPVFAPHSFVGGDLAAMAAPGDWPLADYGEGYEIGPEETATVTVHLAADASRFAEAMARFQAMCATKPVKPRGRHRQTDPADLILADLRDLAGQP